MEEEDKERYHQVESKDFQSENSKESEELVYCAKYQVYQKLEEGCKHPKEYCPYRQTCPLHLFNKDF